MAMCTPESLSRGVIAGRKSDARVPIAQRDDTLQGPSSAWANAGSALRKQAGLSTITEPMSEPRVPDNPALEGLEAKWSPRWETEGTYRFDRSAPREGAAA